MRFIKLCIDIFHYIFKDMRKLARHVLIRRKRYNVITILNSKKILFSEAFLSSCVISIIKRILKLLALKLLC